MAYYRCFNAALTLILFVSSGGLANKSIEVALYLSSFKKREKAIYKLGLILIKNGTILNLGFPRSYSLYKVKNYFGLPLNQTQKLKKIILIRTMLYH